MSIVTASAARQTLPALLDRVEAGEQVEIARHGKVVAVIVRPDVLRSRRTAALWAEADQLAERLDVARKEPLRPATLSSSRADELISAIQADRSHR